MKIEKKLRKNQERYIYYENHHILPKCLGGGNEEENLVLLTAREHFVCHKLLTYIHKRNYKIISAFNLMTFMNKRKYGITSRDYAYARELYNSTTLDEERIKKLKKVPHTKDWNEKISKTLQNHEVSFETRKKISIKNTGIKRSDEARENYKRGNKGKNIGVKHSPESVKRGADKIRGIKLKNEHKRSISIGIFNSRRECEHCHKIIPLCTYNRSHGKKCKVYDGS